MRLVRRGVAHVIGMAAAFAFMAGTPGLMDRLVCILSHIGIHTPGYAAAYPCAAGSAGMGEGGLHLTWAALPYLLALVAIVEAAAWLRNLYAAPVWVPPVVAALGCPVLLGTIIGIWEPGTSVAWVAAVVIGIPPALAFTAYWAPFSALADVGGQVQIGDGRTTTA